ncbi:hypothetical protein ACJX0J_028839 [Zea mays]
MTTYASTESYWSLKRMIESIQEEKKQKLMIVLANKCPLRMYTLPGTYMNIGERACKHEPILIIKYVFIGFIQNRDTFFHLYNINTLNEKYFIPIYNMLTTQMRTSYTETIYSSYYFIGFTSFLQYHE